MSPSGAEFEDLADRLLRRRSGDTARVVVGVVGVPGAGKSTFTEALDRTLGSVAASVPMDGYHLADVELERLGLRDRKGAPETFDAYGYVALLARIRARPAHVVYAPGFERELEQPIAGAIPIGPEPDVVITEGNYLLLDRPEWRDVRSCLDEVWFVHTDDETRMRRLVDRHVRFGKSPEFATRWVERVDAPNARMIQETRDKADVLVDLTSWQGGEGKSEIHS
ncbi:nucleoside/nucleotide kinase family protein [Actinobacteria bacterium YIM 96077]|uniref:Nucleoside/nucleotide kinase family protein n=2 Tax=Phytoactinopolyspora halophila TaxID=1981511 RepID=A0A329QIN7_9ACTN|nr:nucleoside/nucleotide kinase family protein [Actinobacteria bacterium YIM 96077]RAW10298.1 nucleoside/nucleotide kinase family protein [Phytoactinopolyspora halophila]